MVRYKFQDLFEMYAGGDVDKEHFSLTKTQEYSVPIYANSLQNGGLYGYTSHANYPGDSLTITGRGDIGHAEYRPEPYDAIVRLLVLVPKKKDIVDCRFFAEYVNHCVVFPEESTGVPQLTTLQIGNIDVELPSYQEQKAVAQALADIDNLIVNQQAKLEKLRRIKSGMMDKLLTGKIRLTD